MDISISANINNPGVLQEGSLQNLRNVIERDISMSARGKPPGEKIVDKALRADRNNLPAEKIVNETGNPGRGEMPAEKVLEKANNAAGDNLPAEKIAPGMGRGVRIDVLA